MTYLRKEQTVTIYGIFYIIIKNQISQSTPQKRHSVAVCKVHFLIDQTLNSRNMS